MANSDKNILITPSVGASGEPTIVFRGADNNPVTLRVLDSGALSFEGSSGQLFSITDTLVGTIFSVNDISGIPSLEIRDDGTVSVAEFSGNVGIGKATPDYKLDVVGVIKASNGVITLTTSGAPSSTIADGALAVDTLNHLLYVRSGGSWRSFSGPTGPTGPAGAASTVTGPTGPTGDWSTAQTINAKTDDYILLTSDAGKLVTINKGTAVTVTVDGSLDLSSGQRIDLLQLGDGQVTVSGSGATVNGTPGLKLRAKYSAATLLCTGADSYVLIGDLSA